MIIATAGHVDHGKTSLVRQLTGVDTDRLDEEKRRRLSINLGYAYLNPEPGVSLGFIDVPGHRRFINTMIAGISGIDLGLLVVAADDGPMPQTREHLDVLSLLGVEQFILVISKIDRVEPARIDAVRTDLLRLLPATTPVLAVSNTEGTGIDALQKALLQRARERQARARDGHFRLSLDRAFNLKGSGLVVTGTVLSGAVEVGDRLTLMPRGEEVRVRALHAQDESRPSARAGERVALNISGGVGKDDLERGDWVLGGGAAHTCGRFDARVAMLTDTPFAVKHLSPVRLHIGAKRVAAKLFLLNGDSRLQPGQDGLVQLICDAPVHCCHGDRFILRDDSETVTLGGGRVLDPSAPRAGKRRPERRAYLEAMQQDTAAKAIRHWTLHSGQPLAVDAFCRDWNIDDTEKAVLLQDSALGTLHQLEGEQGTLLLSPPARSQLVNALLEGVGQYHEEKPEEPGIAPAALRRRLRRTVGGAAFLPLLRQLLVEKQLGLTDGMLHLFDRKPGLSDADTRDWRAVEKAMKARAHQLPLVSDLVAETGLPQQALQGILQRAVKARKLVRLNPQRYARPADLAFPARCAAELAASNEGLTVVRYKQALDCGRKLAIDILEYFDTIHFTRRHDQHRVIHDATVPEKLFTH